MNTQRALQRLGAGMAAAVLAVLVMAAPAEAAQPPAGYPTSQIMTTATNPKLGSISIRRGFWDSDIRQGFGMDKAWHYHNIPSLRAQRNVLYSPTVGNQANGNYRVVAYAQKKICPNGTNCYIDDEREVWGIYDPNSYSIYYGWPVGGKLGLVTMYCQ